MFRAFLGLTKESKAQGTETRKKSEIAFLFHDLFPGRERAELLKLLPAGHSNGSGPARDHQIQRSLWISGPPLPPCAGVSYLLSRTDPMLVFGIIIWPELPGTSRVNQGERGGEDFRFEAGLVYGHC